MVAVQGQITEAESRRQLAEAEQHNAHAMLPVAAAHIQEAAALEALMPEYDRREQAQLAQKQLQSAIAQAEKDLHHLVDSIAQQEAGLRHYKEEQTALADCPAQAERAKHQADETQRALNELNTLVREWDTLTSAQAQSQQLLQRWQQCIRVTTLAQNTYQHLSQQWFSQQAGHLAKACLLPGLPCPVCGSTKHPHPAELPEEAVEKSAVEQAEQQQELAAALASNRATCAALAQQIQTACQTLAFADKATALKQVALLREKARRIEAAANQWDRTLQQLNEAVKAAQGKAYAYGTQLATLPEIDLAAVQLRMETLAAQRFSLEEASRSLLLRLSCNKQAFEQLQTAMASLAKEDARLAWLSELSRTANGRLEGKEKVMLEAYVQMAYFERMLLHANRRMKTMSRGQYELVRASTAENKRSQSGLELNVRDYVNGTERPVASLSGGEAFLASLSLALGMSDEIQAQEGGIELDVLFVDEGFGSLDDELLQVAVNTLQQLGENRRLVGVISHVQELRDRIDRKIIVRKGADGASQACIVA